MTDVPSLLLWGDEDGALQLWGDETGELLLWGDALDLPPPVNQGTIWPMAVEQDVANAAVFQIPMNFAPAWRDGKGGPKALHVPMVFAAGASVLDFHLFQRAQQRDIEFIQCAYVDNSLNPNTVILKFNGLNQVLTIPANAQGIFPVIVPTTTPKFSATSTGPITVDAYFLNVPLPYAVWGQSVNIPPVTVGVITGAMVDHSGTIAVANTSQAAIAANANRKRVIIQAASANVDALFIDFGTAATVAAGIKIPPGGQFDTLAGPLSTAAINIIGVAGGEAYTAKEIA